MKEAQDHRLESSRRCFIRHPSDIPLVFRVSEREPTRTQRLNNISYGGLSFDSDTAIEEGSVLQLRISLVRPPLEVKGRVCWCQEKNGHFVLGVKFLDTEDAFRVRMVEQICHIEHYKREVFEKEGRVLSGEQAAMEWIPKYGSVFPNPDEKA